MAILESIAGVNLIFTPLILLVVALAPKMDRIYAPAGRYVLWLMVMAGLVLPFFPLRPLIPITVNLQRSDSNPADVPVLAENPPAIAEPWIDAQQIVVNLPAWQFPTVQPVLAPETSRNIDYLQLLVIAWVAGMLLFALYQFLRHLRLARFLKRWALPVTEPYILEIFREEQQGIRRGISLAFAKNITAPMLSGFSRPVIYLADTSYTRDELRLIFRHELFHYRHGHLWCKLALVAIRCLYWYNPAIHLMARQANKDMEAMCDNAVITGMDLSWRKLYSRLILRMAAEPDYSPLTTNFSGGKNMLKQRLANILHGSKKSSTGLFALIGALVLATGLMVGFQFVHGQEVEPEYEYAEEYVEAYEYEEYTLPEYEPIAYEPMEYEPTATTQQPDIMFERVYIATHQPAIVYERVYIPGIINMLCESTGKELGVLNIRAYISNKERRAEGYYVVEFSFDNISEGHFSEGHSASFAPPRPFLGIMTIGFGSDYAPVGLLVVGVAPNHPAYYAGILADDVIVEFNGAPIFIHEDLHRSLEAVSIGQEVIVGIIRDGERIDATIVPGGEVGCGIELAEWLSQFNE